MKTSLLFFRPDRFIGLLSGILVLTSLTAFSQQKYFVTTSGGAVTKDGLTWATAFDGTQLQLAIETASTFSAGNGNQEAQVWVAEGLYKPTTTANRDISFSMRNNVAIYGGFAGTEENLADRPLVNLSTPSSTTLSGDINGAGDSDNSYHVINNLATTLTTSAILDGFIITGGNDNDGSDAFGAFGGGMANKNSSPTLRNCGFVGNTATGGGGAIYNLANSGATCNPVLIDCSFTGNSASLGGALYNFGDEFSTSSPVITHCFFTQNTAGTGGVLYNITQTGANSSPVVTRCTFMNNSATLNSGVIHNEGGSPKVSNCSFIGNTAVKGGVSFNYTVQVFTNCSFSGNTASESGGVASQISGSTTYKNCTFWNNGGSQTFFNSGVAVVNANFCLFDADVASFTGANNLTTTVSPFVSATDLQHSPCSPAINAGDPASTTLTSGTVDQAGNPRFFNEGQIDIGAFESQDAPIAPPVVSAAGESSVTVVQNASLNLAITGCETGTINWNGTNATSGSGSTIPVVTTAVGTVVYSATCTVGGCSSAPGSATVTVTAASVTGSFDGYVYGADCESFRGWAWDRNKINTAVSIDILDGATVIATLPAGDFRQDLLDAGKGNGKHAFRFLIPDLLKDNVPHTFSARVTGSSFVLKNTPKALICQNSTVPPGNQPPVPPTPTVLITPLSAQVDVPFSATLVAFTDPEGGNLAYGLIGLPAGLAINSATRVISGTPTEAGIFVLTYSATDDPGATNSVSFNLTVSPPATTTVTGSFDGYLDKVECGTIRGWVWDRNQPNTPVTVEFYTGSTVWGSTVANIYRVDLKNAGKGNGAHGYSFEVPAALKGTGSHTIYARVQGSSFVLKDSGKSLTCPSPVRLSAEPSEELGVMVLGNPVSNQVHVEVRGALGKPLRLQLIDAQGKLLTEHQIEQAAIVERHQFDVSRQAPGLIVLRASTPVSAKVLKILKAN